MRTSSGWRRFAEHERKGGNGPEWAGEVAVAAGPLFDGRSGCFSAATEGEVGNEWTKFEVDAGGEQRVVHLLSQLMQQRMAAADANPQDTPVAAVGETADSLDLQEKGFHAHGVQGCGDFVLSIGRLFAEETQRQMNPIERSPLHARNLVVEFRERIADRIGGIQSDEQTGGDRFHDAINGKVVAL